MEIYGNTRGISARRGRLRQLRPIKKPMQHNNYPQSEQIIISHNTKMIGNEVCVIKNGGWRGKVESVVDEEYFMISRFSDPAIVEKVSMYDIRSLSYETF